MTYPIQRDRMVKTFQTLVQMNSPSGQERQVADWLAQCMQKLGFEVTEDDAGRRIRAAQADAHPSAQNARPAGNLICRKKGNVQGPTLLFSAHLDTVVPNPEVNVVETNGVLHTDKSTILGADDKAGVAVMVEAAQLLSETNMDHPDLEFVYSVSEETGLDGAKQLDVSQLQAKVGFNLDSGGSANEIVNQAPAQTDFTIAIKGKTAHAGVDPEDGINAIAVAADAISKLQMGRIDEETTINIGVISGGTKTNIVPDQVQLTGEARSISKQKLGQQLEKIKSAFQSAAQKWKATVDIKELPIYEGYDLNQSNQAVQLAEAGCRKIGLSPTLVMRGGGSDANIYNHKGIACVTLGLGVKDNHTVDEHVKMDALELAAALVLGIIESSLQSNLQQQANTSVPQQQMAPV